MTHKSTNPKDYQTLEATAAVMLKNYPAAYHVEMHEHERAQLVYATSGIIELSSENQWWLIPPRAAIWIPANTLHQMVTKTDVTLNTLYIDTKRWHKTFPTQPCSVDISNLLHELLVRAATFPLNYPFDSIEYKVMDLLVEELTWTTDITLILPSPFMDKRLQMLCQIVIEHPSHHYTLEELGHKVGASPRNLTRLFKQALNTNFSLWQQQLKIMQAIPYLIEGKPVSQIATDLGYGSQSSFSNMFKKLMGKAPTEYAAWVTQQS